MKSDLTSSVCPGRHLAEANVWIAIANLLAAFSFSPIKNSNGDNEFPKEEFFNSTDRYARLIDVRWFPSLMICSPPLPFRCAIQPRSTLAKQMVEQL